MTSYADVYSFSPDVQWYYGAKVEWLREREAVGLPLETAWADCNHAPTLALWLRILGNSQLADEQLAARIIVALLETPYPLGGTVREIGDHEATREIIALFEKRAAGEIVSHAEFSRHNSRAETIAPHWPVWDSSHKEHLSRIFARKALTHPTPVDEPLEEASSAAFLFAIACGWAAGEGAYGRRNKDASALFDQYHSNAMLWMSQRIRDITRNPLRGNKYA